MDHYSSFGYTSNRWTYDRKYFYYFNSFPMIEKKHVLLSVSGFKLSFFKFLYGLIRFYSRCELSLRPYLSILALISNLHKIPQTLDLDFHFRLTHLFLMHSFPTPWKHQKKLTVFWCFQGVEKSALGTNGLRYSRGSIPYSLWEVIIF